MPGALFDSTAGSTVGGEMVPTKVAEGVEDSEESGVSDSWECGSLDKDSAAGSVVSGCIFHAAGGSAHVKVIGRKITVTVRN